MSKSLDTLACELFGKNTCREFLSSESLKTEEVKAIIAGLSTDSSKFARRLMEIQKLQLPTTLSDLLRKYVLAIYLTTPLHPSDYFDASFFWKFLVENQGCDYCVDNNKNIVLIAM